MRELVSRRSLVNSTLQAMAISSKDTTRPRDYRTISIRPKGSTTGTSTGPSSGWILAVAGRSALC